ncbi:PH domain-containing protein [Flavobacterium sp. J372]|uniref:PH domain-containing protein n=1 Tax=Flavobacterium sp. J372 TaxID=2898436 RepID=UPI002150A3A4|nr:PH domain-containing protein [Flavobacterium sp. J372]MCR5862468.1 PH domain-containing protein [Flavobacterium sp. J372]
MENFSNETIDVATLPKFEETALAGLEPAYWKVVLFNIALTFLIIASAAYLVFYFADNLPVQFWIVAVAFFTGLLLSVIIAMISFKNKGYAFREHDIIYRTGAIAISTHIIPYNRIQHAALHEGFISRKLGLAAVEIFTAGGDGSDMKIPGLKKAQAENLRQLIVGKIIKQSADE